jgi:hypothetical protein
MESMMRKGGKKKRHKKRKGALPSSKASLTPEKAGTILRHGSVRGHKLTKKQRGMFGSIRGKAGK